MLSAFLPFDLLGSMSGLGALARAHLELLARGELRLACEHVSRLLLLSFRTRARDGSLALLLGGDALGGLDCFAFIVAPLVLLVLWVGRGEVSRRLPLRRPCLPPLLLTLALLTSQP